MYLYQKRVRDKFGYRFDAKMDKQKEAGKMKGWPCNCSQMKALGHKQIYWKLDPWHQCWDLHRRVFCSRQGSGFAYVFIPIKLGSISCLWSHLNMHLTVQTERDDRQNVKERTEEHSMHTFLVGHVTSGRFPERVECVTAARFSKGWVKNNWPIGF